TQHCAGGTPAEAWRGIPEEQTVLQARRAIEENVVEDGVLEVDASAGANHGLAVFPGIPGDANLRPEVLVRLVDRSLKVVEELIVELGQRGDAGQIAVCAAS